MFTASLFVIFLSVELCPPFRFVVVKFALFGAELMPGGTGAKKFFAMLAGLQTLIYLQHFDGGPIGRGGGLGFRPVTGCVTIRMAGAGIIGRNIYRNIAGTVG